MRRRSLRLAVLCAAGFAVACSGDALDPDRTPVASVEVDPPTLSLGQGARGTVSATVRDENGNELRDRKVFWASEDPSVASVSEAGEVTAIKPGSVDVAASSEGKSAIVSVSVSAPVPVVASVSVTPGSGSVFVGRTITLSATPLDGAGRPVSGRTVAWTTTNAAIASVSQGGVVTGISPGPVTIRATADGRTGTATITVVRVPVAYVVVSPTAATVDEKKTIRLTATTYDAANNILTGRLVTWTSSDPSRATVDGTGLVLGRKDGLVTITATSEGKSASALILVKD